jgi:4-amino-4-deoxy-L-arabinose transferase-like glycosyltransferase
VSFTHAPTEASCRGASYTTRPIAAARLETPADDARPSPRPDRFWWWLGAIALAGLAVRLIAIYTHDATLGFSDPLYYHAQGRALADGEWFINAVQFAYDGTRVPSAIHPPFYTLYLGAVSFLGVESIRGHQVATALLGTGTVVAVALAGRRMWAPRAGLLAAAIAAVYPNLWSTDRLLLSESMAGLLAALIVWCGCAYADEPSAARAFVLGAAIALLALTRAEALLLFALLALPLFVLRAGVDARVRAWHLLSAGAAGILVVGPWVGFNLARFEEPTFISTNGGGVIADSYCAPTFDGPKVGWWEEECLPPAPPGDESEQDRVLREQGLDFLRDHQRQLPRVVAIRLGRFAQVYRPWQTAAFDGSEGRGRPAAFAGTAAWLAVLPLGIAGIAVAAARRRPVLPVVSLVVLSALTAAAFYGSPRFRLVGEVALVIAAGVALDAMWSAVRDARRTATPAA